MGNRGTVKWFNEKKGFGFITKNGGGDVFVHYSGIISEGGFRTLKDGQEVTFNLTDGQKGPQAIDVRVVA